MVEKESSCSEMKEPQGQKESRNEFSTEGSNSKPNKSVCSGVIQVPCWIIVMVIIIFIGVFSGFIVSEVLQWQKLSDINSILHTLKEKLETCPLSYI